MTEGIHCIITSFNNSAVSQPNTDMIINKTSQQILVLEGLQESTLYEYCISAFDSTTDEPIGFPVCGMFITAGKLAI